MDFSKRYSKLNERQREAVDTIDGPVMVIAGPGTGKTELLSMRAANILRQTDTLPENILCLTFTESGATAMRTRLASIIGMNAYKVAIHTFHSFGTEIINQNNASFYSGASFRPADELSCYELLHTIFDELDYSNPLSSKMNGEYTYLSDTITAISELKKSGLTSSELLQILDANDTIFDTVEPYFQAVFEDRLAKSTIQQLALLLPKIKRPNASMVLPGIISITAVIGDTLESALAKAEEDGSTTHIRAWRDNWFKKDTDGRFIFKARERQKKLRSVSYVYGRYIERMQEEQLFDFDDMILQVVHAMEVDSELRFNLQEKYQYIMVDEFQDTNLAQMRILFNLANSEVNAGRPNILAVGDDDQAIYSFQGADIGNISSFLTLFRETKRIPLVDNYRSTETILSHARDVITLGDNRLENILSDLDKTLVPHYAKQGSAVRLAEYPALSDERHGVAKSIAQLITNGVSAHSIAVIARRHHELQSLIPYLVEQGIATNYERRDNVLDNEVVKLIELVACIVVALFEKQHDEADSYLPRLLAHPAFAFSPREIWHLSLTAHDKRQKWMETMETLPQFLPIHDWLITLSQSLAHQPLEQMLDTIIGVPLDRRIGDSPFDDNGMNEETSDQEPAFRSPFFHFFFSSDELKKAPGRYLTYLEALRSIRAHLREYQPDEPPTLQSFLEFIRLHRELDTPIMSIRPESSSTNGAINLLTAHKSKGLEFDYVFIIGAIDTAWGEHVRSRNRLIRYPENLPLAPSGDTLDDRLRLFFVAMTRARSNLEISYSLSNDNGKDTLLASFLHTPTWNVHAVTESDGNKRLEAAELAWYQPLITPPQDDLRQLLASRLENYKLSSTHVNNFLDVTHGGPQGFLLNNLLSFPQAMGASAGFGSAVHASLQQAHTHLSATGDQRPLEDVLHDFETFLRQTRLSDLEFSTYLQRGSDALTAFLNAQQSTFTPTQKAELSFAGQSVQIGDIRLTGLLDLIDIDAEDGILIVTDYKTGKPLYDWKGRTDYDKIKLHKYRQQLMFYNLLVRHSRDYSKYAFKKGVLQFVEPTPKGEILALEANFTEEELERFVALLTRVWEHVMALDFPDTSEYDQSYKGILAFEEDLLST